MKMLLLAGGNSSEAAVSINSGRAIYDSLKRLGHDVLAIDPAGGKSLIGADGQYMAPTPNSSPIQSPVGAPAISLGRSDISEVSVVVIALHGGEGENGTIQSLLDLSGMKYTGSGMAASAIAMNKSVAKRLFLSEGVLTPAWVLYQYKRGMDPEPLRYDILSRFRCPFIIKPNEGGSTVGLTKVKDPAEVVSALDAAALEGGGILVEEFISGRELTVAVLDGHPFPVVEIRPKKELYDYEAKYTKGMSEYLAPAPIDPGAAQAMQIAAVKAYNVIGASGLARIDFIMNDAGWFYCLEINTLPGMTNLSLAPMAAKCEGLDFDGLIARTVESALRK